VRPFNNYGPYQHLEKAVPRFVTSVLLGESLTVHGDGSAARDWLFVEDHCEALDSLLHTAIENIKGQVINIGTESHLSVLEVAEAVLRAMGPTESQIEFIGDRPGQVFRHTADASKLKRVIGWEPKLEFEEGLERTIRWYRDNEAWWRPQMWMRHIPIITATGKKEMH
jgi:dTDP-glucose 4,6-dehydratase